MSISRGVQAASAPVDVVGLTFGSRSQHFRPYHSWISCSLVGSVGARRLRQLLERDAFAQGAGWWWLPLAACRRRYRACTGTGRCRAAASQKFGPRIVQPRLDTTHSSNEPEAASMQFREALRSRCVARTRGNVGLTYLGPRRCEKLSDGLGRLSITRGQSERVVLRGAHEKNRQLRLKQEGKGHDPITTRHEKEMRRVVLLCKQVLPC
jgi:hypothetical protein